MRKKRPLWRTSIYKISLLAVLVLLLSQQRGEASTYTLDKILKNVKHNSIQARALEQERLALEAKSLADTASDPIEIFGEGAKAYPELGEDGYEYSVGASKRVMLGSVLEEERRIMDLNNEAYLLEKERAILDFRNGLKNIYHQYCLDVGHYRDFRESYRDFSELYEKKRKAYQYQEISKAELMQLESEKNRLLAQLQSKKMRQEITKERLLILGNIGNGKEMQLSCQDTYPIRSSVNIGDTFRLSKEAYRKRKASTQERLKRYSRTLESIDISGQYTNELDLDKYVVGVSIPLTFTSRRSEQERVAAMHRNSAIELDFSQQMIEKRSRLTQLKSRLKSHALMVKTLSKNYRNYLNNVLPLIKKSYDLGETSVIEYLLNRQKSYQLQQEIYVTKKAYYNTLFKLYTMSEQKDMK